jgi:hypothetical protein
MTVPSSFRLKQRKNHSFTTSSLLLGYGLSKAFPLESLQFAEQPPIGTEPIAISTSNDSAYALNIAHRMTITSVNASKTQAKLHTPCLPIR